MLEYDEKSPTPTENMVILFTGFKQRNLGFKTFSDMYLIYLFGTCD